VKPSPYSFRRNSRTGYIGSPSNWTTAQRHSLTLRDIEERDDPLDTARGILGALAMTALLVIVCAAAYAAIVMLGTPEVLMGARP